MLVDGDKELDWGEKLKSSSAEEIISAAEWFRTSFEQNEKEMLFRDAVRKHKIDEIIFRNKCGKGSP